MFNTLIKYAPHKVKTISFKPYEEPAQVAAAQVQAQAAVQARAADVADGMDFQLDPYVKTNTQSAADEMYKLANQEIDTAAANAMEKILDKNSLGIDPWNNWVDGAEAATAIEETVLQEKQIIDEAYKKTTTDVVCENILQGETNAANQAKESVTDFIATVNKPTEAFQGTATEASQGIATEAPQGVATETSQGIDTNLADRDKDIDSFSCPDDFESGDVEVNGFELDSFSCPDDLEVDWFSLGSSDSQAAGEIVNLDFLENMAGMLTHPVVGENMQLVVDICCWLFG